MTQSFRTSNLELQQSPIFGGKAGYFSRMKDYAGSGRIRGLYFSAHHQAADALNHARRDLSAEQPGLLCFLPPGVTWAPGRSRLNLQAGVKILMTEEWGFFVEGKYNRATLTNFDPGYGLSAEYSAFNAVAGLAFHF